ncbi:MAG: hypothetical protein CMJ74_10485 [Planctomycetaceae bacterium]|nr:hypothetical protein [Planctomycetaceae bacterium]
MTVIGLYYLCCALSIHALRYPQPIQCDSFLKPANDILWVGSLQIFSHHYRGRCALSTNRCKKDC